MGNDEAFNMKDIAPDRIPFFVDFILYLKHLEKKPIKLTKTGMISLASIKELLASFTQRERFEEFKKHGWKMRSEQEVGFLTKIKLIAKLLKFTYTRNGTIRLNKQGRKMLTEDADVQYVNMVLCYWNEVNWGYFSHGREINGMVFSEKLQDIRVKLWDDLIQMRDDWIDFENYAQALTSYYNLSEYFKEQDGALSDFSMKLDIEHALFTNNLELFGCVEVKRSNGKKSWDRKLKQFRVTQRGLFMFVAGMKFPVTP